MRLAVCLHFRKAYRGGNACTGAKGANGGLVYSPSENSSLEKVLHDQLKAAEDFFFFFAEVYSDSEM